MLFKVPVPELAAPHGPSNLLMSVHLFCVAAVQISLQ